MESLTWKAFQYSQGRIQVQDRHRHISILLFLLFFSTCEKDKTNISKSPEVVPSDRPTSSHSEGCHMCQSGQASTAGKGFPVNLQQLGHTVPSRASPTKKPEYTQRRVKCYLFCSCATILHHLTY